MRNSQHVREVAVDDFVGRAAPLLVLHRMSCCFASSRENTMIFAGVPSSPVSSRRTNSLASEPVPPVTRIALAVKHHAVSASYGLPRRQLVDHRVPRRRCVAGRGAKPLPQAAIDHELVVRLDLDVERPSASRDHRSRSNLLIGSRDDVIHALGPGARRDNSATTRASSSRRQAA